MGYDSTNGDAHNWTLPVARKVKEVVSIPVATVGRGGQCRSW